MKFLLLFLLCLNCFGEGLINTTPMNVRSLFPPTVATGTLKVLYKGDSYILSGGNPATNGGVVDTWKDLSGGGFDLTQSVSNAKPTYSSNVQGTFGGVVTDGVDDFLQTTGFTWDQPRHYFMAFIPVVLSGTDQGRYLAAQSASNRFLLYYPFTWSIYNGSNLSGGTGTAGNAYIVEALWNGLNSAFQINVDAAVTGAQLIINSQGLTIGADSDGSSPSSAKYLEIIGYSTVLNAADANIVRAYLNNKYKVY